MRKYWYWSLLVIGLLFAGAAYAQDAAPAESRLEIVDLLKKLPDFQQGVFYNAIDSQLEYMASTQLLTWKGLALEAGYSYENAALLVISYPILKLKDIGVTLPILDLVEFNVGGAVGISRVTGDNEFVAGGTLTLIKVKF
jgi:hypothetical protein